MTTYITTAEGERNIATVAGGLNDFSRALRAHVAQAAQIAVGAEEKVSIRATHFFDQLGADIEKTALWFEDELEVLKSPTAFIGVGHDEIHNNAREFLSALQDHRAFVEELRQQAPTLSGVCNQLIAVLSEGIAIAKRKVETL